MDNRLRRYSMEDDFINEIVTSPKPAKSLMSYVGYIIAVGVIGISVILIIMEVV